MRTITAHRQFSLDRFDLEPIVWDLSVETKFVFQKITFMGDVNTNDGPMKLVRIANSDLVDPTIDVACLITNHNNARVPELWFWSNKFWHKAVDKLGVDYYRDKCFAMYEVEVTNRDELLACW